MLHIHRFAATRRRIRERHHVLQAPQHIARTLWQRHRELIERAPRVTARKVSLALNAGTVWVNCFFVRDLGAPFGGNGKSGIGREGGIWSFDFYSDIKNTVFAPTGWNTEK